MRRMHNQRLLVLSALLETQSLGINGRDKRMRNGIGECNQGDRAPIYADTWVALSYHRGMARLKRGKKGREEGSSLLLAHFGAP